MNVRLKWKAGMIVGLIAGIGFMGGDVSRSVAAEAGKKDIVETAAGAGHFATLAKALQTAGLAETLKGSGPFTVFAPTDEAFEQLPPGTLDSLMKDPAKLKDLLLYHVVLGKVMAKDLSALPSAKTLEGKELEISSEEGDIFINDALVTQPDIEASNGVIHEVDTVLMPDQDSMP